MTTVRGVQQELDSAVACWVRLARAYQAAEDRGDTATRAAIHPRLIEAHESARALRAEAQQMTRTPVPMEDHTPWHQR